MVATKTPEVAANGAKLGNNAGSPPTFVLTVETFA